MHRPIRRMLGAALALALLTAIPAFAQQQVIEVPWESASLAWDYDTADEATITAFRLSCNDGAITRDLEKTVRNVAVRIALPTPGAYACVLYAVAGTTLSDPSNLVNFVIKPKAATNFRIESQQ